MSAWYLFSSLGFYPVNPSSTSYVVGSPFFDKATIKFPGNGKTLVITATDAPTKPYVRSLTLNGKPINQPLLSHEDIINGGELVFEMSNTPEPWGSSGGVTVVHGDL